VLGEYNRISPAPRSRWRRSSSPPRSRSTPNRHTTIGFKEDIEAMPKAYDYSRSSSSAGTRRQHDLVIAGDVEPSETLALVKKYYTDWKGKTAEVKILPEPQQTKERRVDMKWDTETSPRMLIAYHTPAQDLSKKDAACRTSSARSSRPGVQAHPRARPREGNRRGPLERELRPPRPAPLLLLVTLKEEKDAQPSSARSRRRSRRWPPASRREAARGREVRAKYGGSPAWRRPRRGVDRRPSPQARAGSARDREAARAARVRHSRRRLAFARSTSCRKTAPS